jgi:transcription elongation factor
VSVLESAGEGRVVLRMGRVVRVRVTRGSIVVGCDGVVWQMGMGSVGVSSRGAGRRCRMLDLVSGLRL